VINEVSDNLLEVASSSCSSEWILILVSGMVNHRKCATLEICVWYVVANHVKST